MATTTEDVDPIWMSCKSARQIYALGLVDKEINELLALAASSVSLLTLPQTDGPGDALPQGEERIEKFVLEAGEYFEKLDSIQAAIRSSLAQVRRARIAPSAINAPPAGFVPPSMGVALDRSVEGKETRGLQESRVERDAWVGILGALKRMRDGAGEDVAMDG